MAADGAARRANGGALITQRARAGAWHSRARRVTAARSRRDVTGAPPRDVCEGRGRARSRRSRSLPARRHSTLLHWLRCNFESQRPARRLEKSPTKKKKHHTSSYRLQKLINLKYFRAFGGITHAILSGLGRYYEYSR
ncbi:jg4690 [Pararge aegeria aegeria]|uniref:Jg4690 protein n=1 Tax=Pararge aegeria aegeria TaxID=348720 RepID=A0A8S4RD03_9NEOP|nr:jg4690 [Pararge aegeria aegeria]